MKYLKVTALVSILTLIPACSWSKKDCGTACCPTTTVAAEAGATTATEVKEGGADATDAKVAAKPGKEDLDADLNAVMANK